MSKVDEPPSPTQPKELPFPGSLCWRCRHHRAIHAARSTFVMCTARPVKYPRQPVQACGAFDEA